MAYLAFTKLYTKTMVQSSTLLFTKYHMFKRYDMQMTGYILILLNFLYDYALLDLVFFLFTRNLRIDKNNMQSIFILGGSIQLSIPFQFNTNYAIIKIMSLYYVYV